VCVRARERACVSLSLSRVCVCVCVNGDPFKKISSLVRLARAERDGETSGTIATANRAFRAQRDTCTRARARARAFNGTGRIYHAPPWASPRVLACCYRQSGGNGNVSFNQGDTQCAGRQLQIVALES